MVKYVSVSISEKPVPYNKDFVYILLFDTILHVLYAITVEIHVDLLNLLSYKFLSVEKRIK